MDVGAGADKAGAARSFIRPTCNVIRVMCSGRIHPQFVLQAYRLGADGVLILGRHTGDCHYKEGNYRAIQRHRLLLQVLRQFGIEDERYRTTSTRESVPGWFESVRTHGPLVLDAGKV